MSELSYLEKLLDGTEVEWVYASEIFNIKNGYTPSKSKKEFWEDGDVPWFRLEDIRVNGRKLIDSIQHVNKLGVKGAIFPENSIFMSTTATIGEYALVRTPHLTNQQITNFSLSEKFKDKLDINYLFHRFYDFGEWCKENANKSGGLSIIGIKKLSLYKFPIPCPGTPEKSLAIQSEIVRILDTFTALTAELTVRKKQYNYYRDQLLSFDDDEVEWKTLGDVTTITIGEFVRKDKQLQGAEYPVYNGGRVPTGYYEGYNNDGNKIIVSARGANAGFVNKSSTPYWAGNSCYSISVRAVEQLNWMYVYYYLKQSEIRLTGIQQKGGIPAVSKK